MDIPTSQLNVLVVDDHFFVRSLVSEVMRDKNVHHIDMAPNGQIARDMIYAALAENKPYHVVFLDREMPVLSGMEVLKQFRAQPKFDSTAFVMLTVIVEKALVLEALKTGATAYIAKPASKESIGKKFDEVVEWIKKKPTAN